MKWLANTISVFRMFLALTLLLVRPLSIVFFAIYILCGISDVLDGYVARKTDTTSKLGEKLDSVSDFILVAVLLIIVYPILNLTVPIMIWIAVIAIVRALSIIIGFVKFRTLAMIHTYGNKMTGVVLFVFLPLALVFFKSDVLFYVICAVASAATVEELFIQITSKELQINRKSIWIK